MLVKLLTNLGSNDFPDMPFLEGETHEVADIVGARLVRLKLAEDVTPAPEIVTVKMEAQSEPVAAQPSPVVVTPVVPAPTNKTKSGK